MNRKSILIWAMAIGTLSSCMSNEDMYDPEKIAAMKVAKYEAAFVQKYGKVDPKQDWGFGEAETRSVIKPDFNIASINKQWKDVIEVAPILEDEKNTVIEWFKTHQNPPQPIEISWSDFTIQHVSKANGRNMDYLFIGDDPQNRDKHINDFNNGGDGWRMIRDEKLVLGYHNSNDSECYYRYTVQRIGNGYYVGIDYEQHKNGEINADGCYDDWILKVAPVKYKNARRIMAEDLAVDNKSDFDFNDVVFDAAIIDNEAVITLQAVGGTLPLCVGDLNHEVHKLFGVGETEFVNTQGRGEKAPVVFRLSGYQGKTLSDIPIYVDGVKIETKQSGATNMNVPAKLCCPTRYIWAPERKPINEHFPKFKKAVGDATVVWYEDGQPDPDWEVAE